MEMGQVDRFIECVISWGQTRHLEDLVAFREATKATITKSKYDFWVSKAIPRTSSDVLGLVFRLSPSDSKITTEQFSLACQKGSAEVVDLILEEGEFDVNHGSKDTLPLLLAIKGKSFPVIDALLNAGADINIEATLGEKYKRSEGAPLVRRGEVPWSPGEYTKCAQGAPLQVAMQPENRTQDLLKYLLERGATLDTWPWDYQLYRMVFSAASSAGIFTRKKKRTRHRNSFVSVTTCRRP